MDGRTDLSPSDELAELASALRRHARRRRWLGATKVPRPAAAAEHNREVVASTAATQRPPPPPPPAAEPRRPLPPPPPAAPFRPAPPSRPFPRTEEPGPPAESRTSLAVEADRNRALAAGCADFESLRAAVAACTSCGLCKTRTQTVFADGPSKARVMFVGEAPGENEDLQGVPFVGRAGQLLTDIVEKGMGLPRSSVSIANVIKCRPPGNRDPSDAEKALCTPWLDRQIELVDPELIVPLGAHAANHVLGLSGPSAQRIGAVRGKVLARGARKVVATYHPSYLLRSPGEKKECWKDIQVAMGVLGLERPARPG
jgi:uracil-DNA glycosylase